MATKRSVRHADERKGAFDLLPAEEDSELAFLQAFPHLALGLLAVMKPVLGAFVRAVDPAIPDDHLSGAVLAGRNHAFERCIVERMVLRLRREALFARIERRAFGHGPRLEHAIALETKVVMHAARSVLLDDEEERTFAKRSRLGRGFRRRIEAALRGVFGELVLGHGVIL